MGPRVLALGDLLKGAYREPPTAGPAAGPAAAVARSPCPGSYTRSPTSMLTAGELVGTALAQKPTGARVEPRACVRCSYTFTLRRAPLYAPDRRARAHRRGQAGGGDVTPQPAVRVFIFHFRGGSFQSSASDRCPETRTPRPDPGRAEPAFNPALGGHTSASLRLAG